MDHIVLNSLLESLISAAGEDAYETVARQVIAFGRQLPQRQTVSAEITRTPIAGGTATVCATTCGGAAIPHRRMVEHKSWGVQKEWVGHFRIWKQQPGLLMLERRRCDDEDRFCLAYDRASGHPQWFAIERRRQWRIWRIIISKTYREAIFGHQAPAQVPEYSVTFAA